MLQNTPQEEPEPLRLSHSETVEETEPEQETTTEAAALSPEVTSFLEKFQQKVRRRKHFFRVTGIAMAIPALCFYAQLFLNLFPRSTLLIPFYLAVAGLMIVGITIWVRTMIAKPEFEINELEKYEDIRLLPVLLEAIGTPLLSDQRRVIYNAITRLLPRMKASDAPLLTNIHRNLLRKYLKLGTNALATEIPLDFGIAILRALTQIGDAEDVPVVTKIANGRAWSAHQKELKEAAQECLPYLRQRVGLDTPENSLLRPSMLAGGPTELLRPAGKGPGSDPAEMLRPSEKEGNV